MSSADKKKARDRRSQQRLRDKRESRIRALEEQVAHCKQHHQAYTAQDAYLQELKALRHRNRTLLQRQALLKSQVMLWNELDSEASVESTEIGNPALSLNYSHIRTVSPDSRRPSNASAKQKETVSGRLQGESNPPLQDWAPRWRAIPPHDDDFSKSEHNVGCFWFKYMDQIKECPDTPHSPLDIIYGTRLNPLADMICSAFKRRPLRQPERLAMGWFAYHLSKWITCPSPATFNNVPSLLQPVAEQLQIVHPVSLDMVPWPKVRLNLIRQWPHYRDCFNELFGLFACCIRVRWPWGEDVLERNAENTLVMRHEFYGMIKSETGWTITQEFVDQYPEVFVGVNLDSIIYKFI